MQNKKQNFYCGFWNYTFCGALDAKKAAKDWKELGMNLGMSSIYNEKDDKQVILDQLNEAQKNGVKLIICDWRTVWRNLQNGREEYIRLAEEAIADFGNHPAFYAFSVGDEPPRRELEQAIEAVKIINAHSNAFLNFLPMADEPFVSDYLLKEKHEYKDVLIDAVKRSGLRNVCYDNYTQCRIKDREYGLNMYFDNLRIYRETAKECGVDMWTTLLSVGHWFYRVPTEDDIRWQISTAAAHGAKGLLWFFLYTRSKIEDNYRDAPIDWFYNRTETFGRMARQINLFMKFYADRFAEAELKNVYHVNTAYGGNELYKNGAIENFEFSSEYGNDFIVSEFSSPRGDFVAVVNNSQAADGSDRAFGIYGDKKFSLWLAPGQLWIVEK